ncbi:SagB/ThcOx family dehydrogenase [Pseudomonas donghuensis]|uniref:SagB/ThcOx family dehydrogenase n=1 Tax=Pseudomonas donghuensis TaxID=1163398 RepID=UPI0002D6AAA5|nr:SagB/ThcOx family dehydrogenase [Pseudomonas donghuensis]MCP6699207.1 SagB/ThcOx family dehydrogenase [Pseudomonas donghuensis]PJY96235.1 dehydrogenase [Pseudomonas donghuensis]WKY27526.1 SagB/ThcOx family dehydrogenase [Pseudomonas donghuensis]
MSKYNINENIIFTVSKGRFVAWNLQTGHQYDFFDRRFLDRFYELTTSRLLPYHPAAEDDTLTEAGFLETSVNSSRPDGYTQSNWGWDDIARIFHLGSKHNFPSDLSDQNENPETGYVAFCESIAERMPTIDTEREGKTFPLPPNSLSELSTSLVKTLKQRKTSRHFKNSKIDLEIVSNLLFATFGKIHGDSHQHDLAARGVKTVGYRRSSPSAGCLQATEAYLIALNVNSLERGIYHYRSHQHALTLVSEKIEHLNKALCHQAFASDASFLIVMTSRFDKLWWKYPHSRAYRSALLDVGHLSQTFNLVATAYELNTWVTGYFIDDMLNDMVCIDGVKEHSIFVAAAGPGYSDPLSPGIQKLL